jgi:tetratricopeptide (TPR) repeat protein
MTPRQPLIPLLLLILLLSGCASTSVRGILVLPPTTIIGDPSGPRGDTYDAYELFDRGEKAFIAADWPRAQALYEKLLDEYPDTDIVHLARYNLGLVLERQNAFAEALTVYDGFTMPNPGHNLSAAEVRMRRGVCLTNLKRYPEAMHAFEQVLSQFGVPPVLFNETRARLGVAAFYAGQDVLAEHYLVSALAEYEANAARGVPYARAAFAEAYFVMGEIRFALFKQIEFQPDRAALVRSLREKAQALVAARTHYTDAVRTYEPEFVVASLFRVGQCYELFYRSVLEAPDPSDLTPEARATYRDALAVKLKPVMDKALTAYRRTLELAADLNVAGPWVDKARRRYDELGTLAQRAP